MYEKMKKLKNAGFTLIELLAVITIMGILMMVAIPSVTRTIANSRRDTFADIVLRYVDSARNMYVGDNIKCYVNGKWTPASAAPQGIYYIPICTGGGYAADGTTPIDDNCEPIELTAATETAAATYFKITEINSTTSALLEKGGKSSFGSAEMRGYIKIEKKSVETEDGGKISKEVYSALFVDSGLHGFANEELEEQIDRSTVNAELGTSATRANKPDDTSAKVCKVV